jgi:hypothetical protein
MDWDDESVAVQCNLPGFDEMFSFFPPLGVLLLLLLPFLVILDQRTNLMQTRQVKTRKTKTQNDRKKKRQLQTSPGNPEANRKTSKTREPSQGRGCVGGKEAKL